MIDLATRRRDRRVLGAALVMATAGCTAVAWLGWQIGSYFGDLFVWIMDGLKILRDLNDR